MRISIGIPFYNNEKTLLEAIRSVFAQTWQDWELILVNDGSSDRSLEIAQSFSDSRLRVYSDGENRGLASRLNQIAQLARGQYLARMDADDLMHPERLSKQVAYLDSHPEVDLVCTGIYTIDSHNFPQGKRSLEHLNNITLKTLLLNKGIIIHPTVMAKTVWFRTHPYDTSYVRTQDRELWCRSCQDSLFAKIPEPLLFYRENMVNPTSYLKTHLVAIEMNLRLLNTYGESGLGWRGVKLQVFKLYLNVFLYRVFTFLGKQDLLISARNLPLSPEEVKEAQAIISLILNFDILRQMSSR